MAIKGATLAENRVHPPRLTVGMPTASLTESTSPQRSQHLTHAGAAVR
jgi:hypothetical protein